MEFRPELWEQLDGREVAFDRCGLAFDVVSGSPEQFGQFIKDEISLHQKIVKVSGIKPE